MASVSGVADVGSSFFNLSGTLSTYEDLARSNAVPNIFQGSLPARADPEERPQKKRRLDDGTSVSFQSQGVFDVNQSIVLAKVSLVLRFPDDQLELLNPPEMPHDTLLLSLEAFDRIDMHTFTINLWSTTPSMGVGFVATAPTELLDSLTPHLETAASLSTTKDGRKRSRKPRVPFCRCILSRPPTSQDSLQLEIELRWLTGVSVLERQGMRDSIRTDLDLLLRYFPSDLREPRTPWVLSDFYEAVHVPPTDNNVSDRIQKALTKTTLYPFQRRAVEWLLRREGVAFSEAGELLEIDQGPPVAPVSFQPAQDATGKSCYISHVRGMAISDPNSIHDSAMSLRGGILAEEMGLGKTVELIALISHHTRNTPKGKLYDPYLGTSVTPSGATLIISPPSILEQWRNEIVAHSPQLKVLHYKGIPAPSAPKKEHAEATAEYLMQFDVVLTTYGVLSKEIHFATPPPDRPLRKEKVHKRRNSPLVEIQWWRVCLDEAQMVESGVSQAATVARIIPRCNAWAVSGTPLRKDVQDLRGLLIFLRYEPFAGSKTIWERLDKPSFRSVFKQIALRHSKDKIREELQLPPQKRVVITVPFTAIEEQNYSEMIRQMCDACWLSHEGMPLRDDRDADHPEVIERMREWLVRLRQTCLHAHVGRRNRRALGAKNGPLRTVHEVLEVMIDQNDTSLKAEARELILLWMRRGHIRANAKNVEKRSETALPYYQKALEETQNYVKAIREELHAEKEKLGSNRSLGDLPNELSANDSDDEEQSENLGRVSAIRRTLRSFLELEHACKFFIGTVYFQIKSNENLTKPESEEFHRLEELEMDWYTGATQNRKELLKESRSRALRHMRKVKLQTASPLVNIPELPDLGGIESRKILDVMDNVTDLLNAQKEQLEKWRSKIIDILTSPLVDGEDGQETTGEEYEDSTKVQDELYVYIMALRTLIADRNTAVNGLHDLLVEHELKEAEIKARDKDEEKRGHAPELVLEVARIRRQLKPKDGDISLKGVIASARSLITTLQWRAAGADGRAAAELAIAEKHIARIQTIATEQAKALTELEKEQDLFRATMNQRLEFYRQLQHISDTVAPWREELDETFDLREYERIRVIMDGKEKALAGLKTKHAYLTNLRRENQQADLKHECIICQDEFEIGVLTSCGHKYCKECINQWWYQHRTCPLCKQRLGSRDFKDITFKQSAMTAKEENHDTASPSQPSTPSSANSSIYSDLSDSTMKEIKMIDLDGSYGTKVDMIARHLLWIRNNDPGAKSIIFSQFGDFLEVLRDAFRKWKIGASGIRDKDGIHIFKVDPAVECFLLDAKSDSSGLNLVNATYVFLCEPLINPAIELQAIARVHRIGQQRPTAVFMYLVSDTVEEAIYDISVSRRLQHMGRGTGSRSGSATPALQEKTIEAANSLELEAAPLRQLLRKKGDGEVVRSDDLWTCLFGKTKKQTNAVLNREVDRHLRAEAAEQRIAEEVAGSGSAASS